jgi:hypothetical protein
METAKETRNTASRDIDAELGQRAHMLIWSEGRKQGDVAKQIGMSSGSLGLKLKGQRGWALAEVRALAAELGTSVAYLFGEVDAPTPAPRASGAAGERRGFFLLENEARSAGLSGEVPALEPITASVVDLFTREEVA